MAEQWVDGLSAFAPVTRRHYIRRCKALWSWAIGNNLVIDNVFEKIPEPKILKKEIEFLSVKDVSALLITARDVVPEALAYLSLGLFAGIRAAECTKMDPKCN